MATLQPALIGGLVLLGGAVGACAVLVLRRVSLAPLAIPVLALLRALRPLFLPLLAAVVVGLSGGAWYVVLGGSLLAVFLGVRLLVWPERDQLRQAVRWDLRELRNWWWLLAAVALVAALVAAFLEVATGRSLRLIGDLASSVLALALVLWLLAFCLRLGYYSASRLQAGVALFVVLAGLRLGAALGLFPLGEWIEEHAAWLDWALPVAALVLIALEAGLDVWAVARGEDPHGQEATRNLPSPVVAIRGDLFRGRWVRLLQGAGLSFAILAALALLVAGGIGLQQTEQPGRRLSTPTGTAAGEVRQAPPAPAGFGEDDVALAEAYSPVLAFTKAERWTPESVDRYVRGARLSGPVREPLVDPEAVPEKLDRSCPRLASAPCYRLSIRCPAGTGPCGEGEPHPERNDEGLYREGAVYVRVERRAAEEAAERRRETEHLARSDRWPPQVFRAEGPYAKRLSVLLQYWYFYRYDEWETHVFAGQLVQRHEADWEAVTIGLSDSEPLFVAYSAHCAGEWRPWDEVEISAKLPGGSHPLIAVAQGSHANYADAAQKRSPDWAGCQGAPKGTTTVLSYASNIRDKTEYGWQWHQAAGGLLPAAEGEPPMSFPGYWGVRDSTTLYGFFKKTELGEGKAPATPSEQPLWLTPVTKIFCGNYTRPSLPASLSNYHCATKE